MWAVLWQTVGSSSNRTAETLRTKKCRARMGMHSVNGHFFGVLPSWVFQKSCCVSCLISFLRGQQKRRIHLGESYWTLLLNLHQYSAPRCDGLTPSGRDKHVTTRISSGCFQIRDLLIKSTSTLFHFSWLWISLKRLQKDKKKKRWWYKSTCETPKTNDASERWKAKFSSFPARRFFCEPHACLCIILHLLPLAEIRNYQYCLIGQTS